MSALDTKTRTVTSSSRSLAVQSAVGSLLLPISSIITGPLLARTLDPSGRGVLAALLAPVSLANLMFTFGLPESLNFHVAKGIISRRSATVSAVVGGLLAGLIAATVLFIVTPLILRGDPEYIFEARFLAFTLPVTIAFAAYRGMWQGARRFDRINRERLVGVFSRIAALVAFAVLGFLTPVSAAWISVLSGIFGSLVLLKGLTLPAGAERREAVGIGTVASFAAAASVGTFGGYVILRLDQTLLSPLAGARQLGFYAVAASIAELPIAFVAGVRDTVETVAAGTSDSEMAARASRLTVAMLLPVCGVGCLVAPWLVPVLFGQDFAPSVPMTQILLIGTVANGAAAVLGAGLMAAGRPAFRSICQVIGAAATVPLLLLLAPALGGRGAALATSLTYLVLATLMGLLLSRQAAIPLRSCLIPTGAEYRLLIALVSKGQERVQSILRNALGTPPHN